jgi:hypothetical protein
VDALAVDGSDAFAMLDEGLRAMMLSSSIIDNSATTPSSTATELKANLCKNCPKASSLE